jgi:hypothetical protein
MAKKLNVKISDEALKVLTSLQRSSGLKRDDAMSWILVETSVPSIPKRGKTIRGESVDFLLSPKAMTTLLGVCVVNDSSEGVVLEAYLSRKY